MKSGYVVFSPRGALKLARSVTTRYIRLYSQAFLFQAALLTKIATNDRSEVLPKSNRYVPRHRLPGPYSHVPGAHPTGVSDGKGNSSGRPSPALAYTVSEQPLTVGSVNRARYWTRYSSCCRMRKSKHIAHWLLRCNPPFPVRNAAMNSLVQLLELLPEEARASKVAPKVVQFCESCRGDAKLIPGLAKNIGLLIIKMEPHLVKAPKNLETFIRGYCSMASAADEEVRQSCAFNFPAILKVAGEKRYSSMLHDTFVSLAADKSEEVRRIIAGQFHEVSRMLGPDRCIQFLRLPLMKLMKVRLAGRALQKSQFSISVAASARPG
eukprot:scaffold246902_cov43-Prasinocladus_malaysianus.AAC.2